MLIARSLKCRKLWLDTERTADGLDQILATVTAGLSCTGTLRLARVFCIPRWDRLKLPPNKPDREWLLGGGPRLRSRQGAYGTAATEAAGSRPEPPQAVARSARTIRRRPPCLKHCTTENLPSKKPRGATLCQSKKRLPFDDALVVSAPALRAWERDFERYGVHGLRATRLQIYRAVRQPKPAAE
jgi:hypothetical protein